MRWIPLLGVLVILSGCAVGPDYQPPEVDLPSSWATEVLTTPPTQETKDVAWWQHFNDPVLNDLIREATVANLDLEKAIATIRQARANVNASQSAFFPAVTGTTSITQNKPSKSGFLSSTSGSSTGSTGSSGSNGLGSRDTTFFAAGFDASWELDIFGGLRRANEAAEANLASSIENGRSVLITIMAEVAQNYINLRFYQQQRDVLKETAHLWEQYLAQQKDLYQAGLANDIDVSGIERSLSQAKGQITTADTSVKESLHQLGILLGKEPWALYERLQSTRDIPSAPTVMLTSMPSTIIQDRPDIRKAERDLAVATANIGVSFANLFPHFLLTGTLGWQGTNSNQLFKPKSLYYTGGPSATFPIFDFGKLYAQLSAIEALRDEVYITFKETVLNALQDVENGLVSFVNEEERLQHLRQAMDADQNAYELMEKRYTSGLENMEKTLSSHITALQSKLNHIDSLRTRSLDLVSIYKAIGGGWDTPSSLKTMVAKEETGSRDAL